MLAPRSAAHLHFLSEWQWAYFWARRQSLATFSGTPPPRPDVPVHQNGCYQFCLSWTTVAGQRQNFEVKHVQRGLFGGNKSDSSCTLASRAANSWRMPNLMTKSAYNATLLLSLWSRVNMQERLRRCGMLNYLAEVLFPLSWQSARRRRQKPGTSIVSFHPLEYADRYSIFIQTDFCITCIPSIHDVLKGSASSKSAYQHETLRPLLDLMYWAKSQEDIRSIAFAPSHMQEMSMLIICNASHLPSSWDSKIAIWVQQRQWKCSIAYNDHKISMQKLLWRSSQCSTMLTMFLCTRPINIPPTCNNKMWKNKFAYFARIIQSRHKEVQDDI